MTYDQRTVDDIAKIDAEKRQLLKRAKALMTEAEQRAHTLPQGNYLTSDDRALVLVGIDHSLEVLELTRTAAHIVTPLSPPTARCDDDACSRCPGFVASLAFADVCQNCGESEASHL